MPEWSLVPLLSTVKHGSQLPLLFRNGLLGCLARLLGPSGLARAAGFVRGERGDRLARGLMIRYVGIGVISHLVLLHLLLPVLAHHLCTVWCFFLFFLLF